MFVSENLPTISGADPGTMVRLRAPANYTRVSLNTRKLRWALIAKNLGMLSLKRSSFLRAGGGFSTYGMSGIGGKRAFDPGYFDWRIGLENWYSSNISTVASSGPSFQIEIQLSG